MLSVQARLDTDRASHYLAELFRHAAAMVGGGHRIRRHTPVTEEVDVVVESSDTVGTITFGWWGRCAARADTTALTARIDAVDEDKLQRIQAIIGRNLDRYGRREGVTVTWQRLDTTAVQELPGLPDVSAAGKPAVHRVRRGVVAVTAAVVLVVAVHLGLGAAVLTTAWSKVAVGLILVLVALKAAVVAVGIAVRRQRSRASV